MRKTLLGLAVIAAIATPLAFASSANAAVAVDNGIGLVDKGDIQASSALDLNNGAFQTSSKADGSSSPPTSKHRRRQDDLRSGSHRVTRHLVIDQPVSLQRRGQPVHQRQRQPDPRLRLRRHPRRPDQRDTGARMETIPCPAVLRSGHAGVTQSPTIPVACRSTASTCRTPRWSHARRLIHRTNHSPSHFGGRAVGVPTWTRQRASTHQGPNRAPQGRALPAASLTR